MLMVNSKGEIIEADKEIMTDFPDFEKRKAETLNVLQYISDSVKKKFSIAYAYQKEDYKEKVYIPFKEEIPSSDKLAKEYIEFKNGTLKDESNKDVLKSIVRTKSEKGIRFFLLALGCIVIERNYADNEIISFKYMLPVPYCRFAREIKQETEYTLISTVSYETMFKSGTVIPYSEKKSKLDSDIEYLITALNKNKATDSNKATECLIKLSGKRKDFFVEYKDIKNMIIKTFPKSRGIIYDKDKSCIRAVLKRNNTETLIFIFVGGTQENPCYIFRGRTAESIDRLKALLIADEKEEEWFTKVINVFK